MGQMSAQAHAQEQGKNPQFRERMSLAAQRPRTYTHPTRPIKLLSPPPISGGGLDLGSAKSGCARLGGSKVPPPPLRVVNEKVVVVVVLVRRHRRAVDTAVRRAVD